MNRPFNVMCRCLRSRAALYQPLAGPSRQLVCPPRPTTFILALVLQPPGQSQLFSTTLPPRSGHNRWSKIRHKKGAADAQRSALFSRLTSASLHDIHQALKAPASHDPEVNPRLAVALAKAREGGVPKNNVEAALARAKSAADGTGQTITYEAVGPGGKVGIIIAHMSPISYLFERKGLISISPTANNVGGFEELFELAVDGGAEDVREIREDGETEWEITTPASNLSPLTSMLSAKGELYAIQSSELAYLPLDPLAILAEGDDGDGINEERAESVIKIVELLEEEADVVRVWTNLADE
ncbi:translational activator of cytochrome c oxidase 1, partial [Tremellales sp. Uapishka_1]